MKLKIIIDTRETGSVAKELTELGVPYEILPLSVGDFAIETEDSQKIAIWERKTCADLAASINDGRYAEQKGRLLAAESRWKGYIIEGYYTERGVSIPKTGGRTVVVPRTTIDSVKLGLCLRDGFTVYELADARHTAIFLSKMLTKLPEYLSEGTNDNYEEALIKSISTVRKENMTPEICYLAQLCQIPGVSHNIAQAIHSTYPNMRALLCNLNPKELAEIKVADNRRLGKVLAQRFVEYLGDGGATSSDAEKPKPIIKRKI